MDTVRVGVVGVGGMGTFHARTLAALPGVELVAVADPFVDNAERLHDELGCRAESDPMTVAADETLQGVVIASPDETHADLAIAALAAGSFVLCEKPLATSVADAERVVDAERALGYRRIQLGFMREYDPAHRQLVAALGDLGQIDYVRAVHRNANDTPRPLDEIVGQSMVHDVHTVRFVTGAEVTSVDAHGSGAEGDSFRYVVAVCRLSNGAMAVLEFDDGGFAYDVSVEVVARRGDALTGPPLRAVTRREGSVETHLGSDWFGWFADAYRIQDQAWVDSIRAGAATGPTVDDGYAAQVVVRAIRDSLARGETVAVARRGHNVPGTL